MQPFCSPARYAGSIAASHAKFGLTQLQAMILIRRHFGELSPSLSGRMGLPLQSFSAAGIPHRFGKEHVQQESLPRSEQAYSGALAGKPAFRG